MRHGNKVMTMGDFEEGAELLTSIVAFEKLIPNKHCPQFIIHH